MDRDRLTQLGKAALPILAMLSFLGGVTLTLGAAGQTLGFDFLAYHRAAVRLLAGQPLYDMSFTTAGGFGLFFYPPTSAPIIVPFGLLSATVATWTWIGLSIVVFLVGVALLPVARSVRWWLILLAGLSFPFVYAVKLGQVGPILFGLFALGWRYIERPVWLGLSGAIGAAIKLQPGLVLVWALATRRFGAVLAGAVALGVLAVAAVGLAGVGAWPDFLTLLRTVSDPITTPHNFTPGAVAFQLGVPAATATWIQFASTAAAVIVFLTAVRGCSPEASYLVAVIASQLVSPIIWDHYAMLLLLPVAYLLAAGRWWALAIPLVTAWPLVNVTLPVIYPVVFWVTLLATFAVGRMERRSSPVAVAIAA